MDSTSTNDPFSVGERPQAPTILIHFSAKWYSLHCHRLEFKCEFNVSTAFVKMTGTWINTAKLESDLVFVLPTKGTVTSVNVEIQERRNDDTTIRKYDTMVIPTDMAEEIAKDQPKIKRGNTVNENGETPNGQIPADMSFNDYVPDLFRLPIKNVKPGEQVNISVVWIEPLSFIESMYSFTLPMNLNPELLPRGKTFDDVISFEAVINSVQGKCAFLSKSHDVTVIKEEPGRVAVKLKNFARIVPDVFGVDRTRSVAIHFGYSLVSSDILPTLINEPKKGTDEGNFLLFVTPPLARRLHGQLLLSQHDLPLGS